VLNPRELPFGVLAVPATIRGTWQRQRFHTGPMQIRMVQDTHGFPSRRLPGVTALYQFVRPLSRREIPRRCRLRRSRRSNVLPLPAMPAARSNSTAELRSSIRGNTVRRAYSAICRVRSSTFQIDPEVAPLFLPLMFAGSAILPTIQVPDSKPSDFPD